MTSRKKDDEMLDKKLKRQMAKTAELQAQGTNYMGEVHRTSMAIAELPTTAKRSEEEEFARAKGEKWLKWT